MGCRTQSVSCLKEAGYASIKTLLYPIKSSVQGMCRNKKITMIVLIAIAILVICAKYVNTQPMHNFNKGLLHGYKVTAEFLSNKTHAILVGCTGGILYLLIGRELVNTDNKREAYNNGWSHGYDAPRFVFFGETVDFSTKYIGEITKYTFNVKTLQVKVVK